MEGNSIPRAWMLSGQGQNSVCIFRMDLLVAAFSFPIPHFSWEVENYSSFQGNASWGSLWPVLLLGAALRRVWVLLTGSPAAMGFSG